MTTNQRIYPGMLDDSVEFFNAGNSVKVIANGTVKPFKEIPMPVYQSLKEEMQRHPEAVEVLRQWHPESELEQMEKFAHCRFGGLDFTPDFGPAARQHGEYWDCPFRGRCEGEGKVCNKLTYKGSILEAIEISLLKCMATNKTNETIAEELKLAFGTFHQIKKGLYAKLGNIQTKQEATLIAFQLNLI